MRRFGLLCSVIRQAVTAIENRESARTVAHKQEALWRVAMGWEFVRDADEFARAIA
ncbi:MAG TPA: hypothetical protein VNL70_01790 [Tepidisphaeraceae bacterium]|nr:hypothetical protein [Tepidisphaeraceae bacterium]